MNYLQIILTCSKHILMVFINESILLSVGWELTTTIKLPTGYGVEQALAGTWFA